MRRQSALGIADVDFAERQLAAVETRIAGLQALHAELTRIQAASCSGGRISDCRVIEALGNHAHCDGLHA